MNCVHVWEGALESALIHKSKGHGEGNGFFSMRITESSLPEVSDGD